MSNHWCDLCGGVVLDDGTETFHVCLPEQADGFSLGNKFYRFDRDLHVWLVRVPCSDEEPFCWEFADLPTEVLIEVAHMRHQLVKP